MRAIVSKLRPRPGRLATEADVRREAGLAALERGDLASGRLALLQSLDLAPPSLDKAARRRRRLALAGLSADAERVLRQSAELFIQSVEPRLELARLFLEGGDAAAAVELARGR